MRAKEYLDSGKFGDIVMADMTWNVNQPGRWRRPSVVPTLKQEDTDWKRYLINRDPKIPFDARKYLEFRLFWPFSSGIPDQWMVHQIDTVHWFTGIPHPRSVVVNGGLYLWKDGRQNWDTMTAVFDYHNAKTDKAFQVLYSSQDDQRGRRNQGDLLFEWRDAQPRHEQGHLGGWSEGEHGEADGDEGQSARFVYADSTRLASRPRPTPVSISRRSPTCVTGWIASRSAARRPMPDIHAAYNHSVALCMAIAAIQTGKRVTFDDKKQDVVIS
jgi:predicted dehydrogenase